MMGDAESEPGSALWVMSKVRSRISSLAQLSGL